MGVKAAPQPLNPDVQWTSRGQKKDTGDLVKRKSART
jgi:hypothetical protein